MRALLPPALLCAALLGAAEVAAQPGFATLDEDVVLLDPGALAVTFRLVSTAPPRVEIQLDFLGAAAGATELALTPGWGGVERPGDDVAALEAVDLDRERTLLTARSDHSRWRVVHEPYARVRVRYAIGPTEHRASTDPRVHYRPILETGLFHSMGELTLLRPSHLDNARPRQVQLRWTGFAERGWRAVSSFGVGSGPFHQTIPLRKLREGLFVAGRMAIFERALHEQPVAVAVAGEDWSFAPEDFADLVVEILHLERTFFGDDDHPFFLVSLLPVGDETSQGRSLGGTSLHRSFATFATANSTLEAGAGLGLDIPRLLLHELFHQWNGRVLRMGPREERMYWFSEGFTSFYTRRFAIAGGWYDVADFVTDLNTELAEYAANTRRLANADTIEAHFFRDREVQRVPYLRGSLIAARLDYELRRLTVGARNIDDFMRDLVDEALATPEESLELSNELLFDRIAEWTSPDLAAELEAVALEGAPLDLPTDLFAPALTGLRDQNGQLRFARTRESAEVLGLQGSGR